MSSKSQQSPVVDAISATAHVLNSIEHRKIERPQRSHGDASEPHSISEVPASPVGDATEATEEQQHLVSDVMAHLEQLIVTDEWMHQGKEQTQSSRRRKLHLPPLDELGRSVVTCYSLKAYIDLLQPQHRTAIATWLYHHTAEALRKLFRVHEHTIYFHDDKFEGILRMVKTALHTNAAYHDLQHQGFNLLAAKRPVVYVSESLPYSGIERYLVFEMQCVDVHVISSEVSKIGHGAMDMQVLERRMAEDTEAGKVPVLVLASAGSAVTGKSDNLEQLLLLKEKYKFWIHLDGLELAQLCLKDLPKHLMHVPDGVDSFMLPLATYLGVVAVPYLTMHRNVPLFTPTYHERLASMPWWVVTRHLLASGIRDRISHALHLGTEVLKALLMYKQLNVLAYGLSSVHHFDQMRKAVESNVAPGVVLFKFRGNDHTDGMNEWEYNDSCNTWLGQGLAQECPHFGLHNVSAKELGICVRFCPLETVNSLEAVNEDVEELKTQLKASLGILEATVNAKNKMSELLTQYPALRVAEVHRWAGVGGVIYVPSMLRGSANWNEKQREQVSHLNIELMHHLRQTDSAFSLGEEPHGISCVKFGMLADENDLRNLVEMVANVGKHIEESSQYIESLAQLVKQGIDAANEDLKKENENRLAQEGVLRQLPMVGSLLNWWSPLPREAVNMRGRSFDLVSGQVASTEQLYSNKLQIQRSEPSVQTHGQGPALAAANGSLSGAAPVETVTPPPIADGDEQ